VNAEVYNIALRNALSGIKGSIADLNWSFILTNDGTVVTSDDNPVDPNMTKAASSLQSLAEKANTIGGLDNVLINGEKNKIYVSSINDMYLVAGLDKSADLVYFRTITSAVLPTVLKVLDSVTSSLTDDPTPFKRTPAFSFPPASPKSELLEPTPSEPVENQEQALEENVTAEVEEVEEAEETEEMQKPALDTVDEVDADKQPQELPSQQLIVDRFGGFMVKSDTVQLDAEILKRWSDELNVENVNEVDVETFSGKAVRCKTKVISDAKLEGRGLIRIPEKACQSLDVRRGELVRVKPVVSEESD
jgi:predicted regulator of Ras-like GTPase activity (Roadblock/LC7/MglB family)